MDEVQKPTKPKTIPVTPVLHSRVKVAAAMKGKTIQDYVGEIVTQALERENAA